MTKPDDDFVSVHSEPGDERDRELPVKWNRPSMGATFIPSTEEVDEMIYRVFKPVIVLLVYLGFTQGITSKNVTRFGKLSFCLHILGLSLRLITFGVNIGYAAADRSALRLMTWIVLTLGNVLIILAAAWIGLRLFVPPEHHLYHSSISYGLRAFLTTSPDAEYVVDRTSSRWRRTMIFTLAFASICSGITGYVRYSNAEEAALNRDIYGDDIIRLMLQAFSTFLDFWLFTAISVALNVQGFLMWLTRGRLLQALNCLAGREHLGSRFEHLHREANGRDLFASGVIHNDAPIIKQHSLTVVKSIVQPMGFVLVVLVASCAVALTTEFTAEESSQYLYSVIIVPALGLLCGVSSALQAWRLMRVIYRDQSENESVFDALPSLDYKDHLAMFAQITGSASVLSLLGCVCVLPLWFFIRREKYQTYFEDKTNSILLQSPNAAIFFAATYGPLHNMLPFLAAVWALRTSYIPKYFWGVATFTFLVLGSAHVYFAFLYKGFPPAWVPFPFYFVVIAMTVVLGIWLRRKRWNLGISLSYAVSLSVAIIVAYVYEQQLLPRYVKTDNDSERVAYRIVVHSAFLGIVAMANDFVNVRHRLAAELSSLLLQRGGDFERGMTEFSHDASQSRMSLANYVTERTDSTDVVGRTQSNELLTHSKLRERLASYSPAQQEIFTQYPLFVTSNPGNPRVHGYMAYRPWALALPFHVYASCLGRFMLSRVESIYLQAVIVIILGVYEYCRRSLLPYMTLASALTRTRGRLGAAVRIAQAECQDVVETHRVVLANYNEMIAIWTVFWFRLLCLSAYGLLTGPRAFELLQLLVVQLVLEGIVEILSSAQEVKHLGMLHHEFFSYHRYRYTVFVFISFVFLVSFFFDHFTAITLADLLDLKSTS